MCIRDSLREGPAIFSFSNKNQFQGVYTKGIVEGIGKITFSDGSIFEGEFQKNYSSGQGKLTYSDRMVFEGRYLRGKRNGEAFIEFQDKTKITANYTDDIASGPSNFISKDGQTYQLKIGKELLDGFVSIKFPDQADFAGTYLKGLRNGEGVFRLSLIHI